MIAQATKNAEKHTLDKDTHMKKAVKKETKTEVFRHSIFLYSVISFYSGVTENSQPRRRSSCTGG